MESWAIRNLNANLRGDSWKGIPLIRIRIKGVAPAVALASARLIFKKHEDDAAAAYELSSLSGGVVITDAAAWEVAVPEVLEFPLAVGTYYYAYKTVNVNGFKRTYLKGTMTIARNL